MVTRDESVFIDTCRSLVFINMVGFLVKKKIARSFHILDLFKLGVIFGSAVIGFCCVRTGNGDFYCVSSVIFIE